MYDYGTPVPTLDGAFASGSSAWPGITLVQTASAMTRLAQSICAAAFTQSEATP
jgi:hypothetical protein